MISSRFTKLTPNRQMTLKPGDENYETANSYHQEAKKEVEEARDFFNANDNVDDVDQNPAKGAVQLSKVDSPAGLDNTYSGELKANGDFEYDHSAKNWADGANFGASKTDKDGTTTYFTYNDPGMYEVMTYYTLTSKTPNGVITYESGSV